MQLNEITPKKLLHTYLKLVSEDVKKYFYDKSAFVKNNCPACDSSYYNNTFIKNGFNYVLCDLCCSLFVSPSPDENLINEFYSTSKSSDYWANQYYPLTAEVRRNNIMKPRLKYLVEYVKQKKIPCDNILEIGSGYGLFLEELEKSFPDCNVYGLEPGDSLFEVSKNKGLNVINSFVEDLSTNWNNKVDIAISFELLEHLINPYLFFKSLSKKIKKGGTLWMTGIGVDGFDVQVLWNNHINIYPPCHINILSKKGIEILFSRSGFESIEITTPGKLDVQIVKNANFTDFTEKHIGEFLGKIIKNDNVEQMKSLQNWLVNQKLSSHTWIISRKKNDY